MKPPKCKTCGKAHWGLCAGEPVDKKVSGGTGRKSPEDIGRASEEKACETAVSGEVKGGSHRPSGATPPGDKGVRTPALPLTPAQRSKRYRENLGDEYRKRNRERMRKKRNG